MPIQANLPDQSGQDDTLASMARLSEEASVVERIKTLSGV